MEMKKLLALLLAACLLAGLLAGCTGGSSSGGQTADANYLKEYKSTFSSPITTMNQYTTSGTSDYVFISNLVDGLVETDKYGRPVPCLAESWEHNDDYSVWTFHLRDGVYWVDSTGAKTDYKVTADDFVAGMRYVAEPNHSASSFSTIRGVIDGLYDYYYNLVDIDDGEDIGLTREEAEAALKGETKDV